MSLSLKPDKKLFVQTCGGTHAMVYSAIVDGRLCPQDALEALRRRSRYPFLLESADGPLKIARYSIVGCDPFLVFRSKKTQIELTEGERVTSERGNPILKLRAILSRFSIPKTDSLPDFFGGAVGYFGYDIKNFFEELPDTVEDDLQLPDCICLFVDKVIVFDRKTDTAQLVVCVFGEADEGKALTQARQKAEAFWEGLVDGLHKFSLGSAQYHHLGEIASSHDVPAYVEMVNTAKEYIAAGDIFQANLSQRLAADFGGDAFSLYKALEEVNPSPFAFYFDFGDFQLVSCSPERLVRLKGDRVQTRPIAGTRPRGTTSREDTALMSDLLLNPKERAEHVMIVDMARNDIGRVCRCGTVRPDEFMVVEKYSHVFHIVSNVVGTMLERYDCFDLLAAVFPGASITGVPKVRCMEIIDELEGLRRGPYTGSAGWISFAGDTDLNIIIRTFVIKGGYAYIQVGGGIVAGSEPEQEYYETLHKAEALLEALRCGAGSTSAMVQRAS